MATAHDALLGIVPRTEADELRMMKLGLGLLSGGGFNTERWDWNHAAVRKLSEADAEHHYRLLKR